VQKSLHLSNARPRDPVTLGDPSTPVGGGSEESAALASLAADVRSAAWEVALEVVEDGLRAGTVPSLARLGQIGQVGDLPTFIGALAGDLATPAAGARAPRAPLTRLVRDHAREREALGFAPREIVAELMLVGRALSRLASRGPQPGDDTGARAQDAIDRLVTECVIAYFERATSELALRARADPLTGLLNHQAFTEELGHELERARRYEHGLALVLMDVDHFKEVNDTRGHPEGDRLLRCLARVLRETLRASDPAGRMGGDEFAVCLLESDTEAAGRFLARVSDRIDELAASGEVPGDFAVSPGVAHFPSDGVDADTLFRLADARLYDVKRSRR
jgi:diguanylate cyclase (GGDEF)-like protein